MAWDKRGGGQSSLCSASLMRDGPSSSAGVFKQLDPENTGTIQLDLISVSPWFTRPSLRGKECLAPGHRDLWLSGCLLQATPYRSLGPWETAQKWL